MTLKQKRQAIKDLKERIPRGEFRTGLFIKTVGSKWVHVLSLMDGASVTRELIEDFWWNYVADFDARCAAGGIEKHYC